MRRSLLVSALVLALAGCQSAPAPRVAPEAAPQPAPVAAVETPAANDNLNALAWMQAAEEYRLATGQTYRAAAGTRWCPPSAPTRPTACRRR